MVNWKDVFNDETCKCGEKGTNILSLNTKIVGFACDKHHAEEQSKLSSK